MTTEHGPVTILVGVDGPESSIEACFKQHGWRTRSTRA
ncbi:hypothetical protein ART_0352 [Arthrobacter sp. PAMC 25486]|nr:hypothetical protein ART_0352 [Arthrobacter sp. PAMC 25486]